MFGVFLEAMGQNLSVPTLKISLLFERLSRFGFGGCFFGIVCRGGLVVWLEG